VGLTSPDKRREEGPFQCLKVFKKGLLSPTASRKVARWGYREKESPEKAVTKRTLGPSSFEKTPMGQKRREKRRRAEST